MGKLVMVMGQSGSGKSASLRNFKKGEIGIINVCGKPLPFMSDLASIDTDDYEKITNILHKATAKTIVIDDCQYLMANEFMRNAKVNGYQKFTDIGLNFWNLIRAVIALPDDVIVYFLAHTERDADGNEKMKTIGKMLDEKITIEGMFTIVLKTVVQDGHYYFSTQTNGQDTVKTPIGMFVDNLIDNDLKAVDDRIREFYNIKVPEGEANG